MSIDISRKYEDSSGNAMGRTRCNGDVLDVHNSGIYNDERTSSRDITDNLG